MTASRSAFLLALALGLGACSGGDVTSNALPPNFLAEAPRLVAEADWSAPETVSLVMVDHAFQPPELTLRRDIPTRLVVENRSDSDHSLVADAFFREVATKQVVGPTGAVAAPWLRRLEVPAGQTKELWLVPARYGAYSFKSDVLGDSALGMTGLINVGP